MYAGITSMVGYIRSTGIVAVVALLAFGAPGNVRAKDHDDCVTIPDPGNGICIYELNGFLNGYDPRKGMVTEIEYIRREIGKHETGDYNFCRGVVACISDHFNRLNINGDGVISKLDDLNCDNKVDLKDADLMEDNPVRSCDLIS